MVKVNPIASRGLWTIVWAGLVIFTGLTAWLGLSGLTFPYELDNGEGNMLEFTRLLSQGQPIYKNLFQVPFAESNYPPVVLALAAPFWNLFHASYAPGRALNLAATLMSAFLIFALFQSEVRHWKGALLSALFFLSSTFIYHWSPLYRVDLAGLGFTLGGICLVLSWESDARAKPNKDYKKLIWAGLSFLLAVYSKHSLLAGPIAAAVAIFLLDRRSGILFAGGLGLVGSAIFLVIDYSTQGGFWSSLIIANASEWRLDTFQQLFSMWVQTHFVLILFSVWEFAARIRNRRIGVLELYFGAALASVGLSGRVGAWENYYFEAIAIVCLFAGLRIADLIRIIQSKRLYALNLALPLALIAQLVLYIPEHDPRTAIEFMDETYKSNLLLAPVLKETSGEIVSEDLGALVTASKPIVYYPFIYSSLARAGKWDQHWELEKLRTGAFTLVILDSNTRQDVDHYRRLTHEFLSELDVNYALTETAGNYEIYRPGPIPYNSKIEFEDKLMLIGWAQTPEILDATTKSLTISLLWRAQRDLKARYTAFVHLEDTQGRVISQSDREPRGGAFPTTRWVAGDVVREIYTLTFNQPVTTGKYFMRAGWYDTSTEDRLSVGDQDYATLKEIVVP